MDKLDFYIETIINDSKQYVVAAGQLEVLISMLLDGAALSYDKEYLKIGNDKTIMEYIKAIEPKMYEERFKRLKNAEKI